MSDIYVSKKFDCNQADLYLASVGTLEKLKDKYPKILGSICFYNEKYQADASIFNVKASLEIRQISNKESEIIVYCERLPILYRMLKPQVELIIKEYLDTLEVA